MPRPCQAVAVAMKTTQPWACAARPMAAPTMW